MEKSSVGYDSILQDIIKIIKTKKQSEEEKLITDDNNEDESKNEGDPRSLTNGRTCIICYGGGYIQENLVVLV